MRVASSLWQGSAFAYQQSMAAHEHARERQDPKHECQQRPKRFGEDVEPAEMEIGEPGKNRVSKPKLRRPLAIEDIDNAIERLREGEIDPRDSPHYQEKKTPESQHVVQVPIDPRKTRSPIHCQAAAPIRDSRPPDNRSGQAKQGQRDAANAVQPKAFISE